jgi:hypothetical protein
MCYQTKTCMYFIRRYKTKNVETEPNKFNKLTFTVNIL